MELKRIGVLSLAKIACLFGIIYGLISGIVFSLLYSKIEALISAGQQIPQIVTLLGYWSILVLPVLNGIIYFVAGVIAAALYNLFAGWVGGIKLEFKK